MAAAARRLGVPAPSEAESESVGPLRARIVHSAELLDSLKVEATAQEQLLGELQAALREQASLDARVP